MEITQFTTDFLIEKLKGLNIFNRFDENQVKGFIAASALKVFAPGEIIIREGDTDNWIYFLVSGRVNLIKNNQLLAVFQRIGDIFGEMRIVDKSPRSASIVADTETRCLGIEFSRPERAIAEVHPVVVYRAFAEVLADRLRATTEELARVKQENETLKKCL
jgi:CRP-like cAMP-binding protein